jgi:hypothetical protein
MAASSYIQVSGLLQIPGCVLEKSFGLHVKRFAHYTCAYVNIRCTRCIDFQIGWGYQLLLLNHLAIRQYRGYASVVAVVPALQTVSLYLPFLFYSRITPLLHRQHSNHAHAACLLLCWIQTAAIGQPPCDTTTGMSYSFPEIRMYPYRSSRPPVTTLRTLVSTFLFLVPFRLRLRGNKAVC